jgi:hypothetical protein
LDHLQRHTPGGNCGLSAGFEHTQGLDHPVTALGRDHALAAEGCVGGILGAQVVIFATLAAVVPVWCRDLQNVNAGVLHVTQKPRTIGASCLDANAPKLPEGPHPGEHLLVAVPGCREALASQNAIMFVDNSRDMKILVRVDATDHATNGHLLPNVHCGFPGSTLLRTDLSRPDAWTGQ